MAAQKPARRGQQITTTIAHEAFTILRRHAPAKQRCMGQFLSRLLYEHEIRTQERQQVQSTVENGQ